ncbi:sensor histidine kinase [Radiobacillus kanasensis]|uniref:sensor histidine kinase n=1 Tax=Radiobacillus kanasensis TaxID=2844358 RepID=UPI001E5A6C76|nr:sensor histidine kinase [Radiobacillus kanasensis]UFT98623.1 sensor histidine kinase [Radiobacillus kanasensis]
MSIFKRSIGSGILASLLVIAMSFALFFVAFPLDNWQALWNMRVFELPIVLDILIGALFLGSVIGAWNGWYWKQRFKELESGLEQLQKGTFKEEEFPIVLCEMKQVAEKLSATQRYLMEQTKISQKLVDERVEDQEKKMEEVISEERNRLARELHDSVSQELFAASMMVSAITEGNVNWDDLTAKQLQQVEMMIQQSQLEMRALLLHLRPVALKDKSLTDGMKQLLEELKQKVPIEVTWKMEPVPLSKGVEDHLFRIFQESVSNTLRHSKARSLDIWLNERDGFVILRVMDDGIGFDLEESQSGSYGLQNMKERAAEVGATLRVVSIPNQGTRLEVRVPIIGTEGDEND